MKTNYRQQIRLFALMVLVCLSATQLALRAQAQTLPPEIAPIVISYSVKPSNTDGQFNNGPSNSGDDPCPTGIGCDSEKKGWGDHAINKEHFLYLSSAAKTSGKLLVFLPGGSGNAGANGLLDELLSFAALQGYHVIGLTYPASGVNCSKAVGRRLLACYGDVMREIVTGQDTTNKSELNEHPQDSILNRLIRVLQWARFFHSNDGWGRYLTSSGQINWSQVHLAGFSNGSSFASFMGTLYPTVERVTLFAGPNDGLGGTTEADWISPFYVTNSGFTDNHYYGLVHIRNHAEVDPQQPPPIYQVTKNWLNFGMEGPYNPPRLEFVPNPNSTSFKSGGAHMLISIDPQIVDKEAHHTVVRNRYCSYAYTDPDKCVPGARIGYEPAWRCVLGSGDAKVSSPPTAHPGTDQIVASDVAGGAYVSLDGSLSSDPDCDVLGYKWTTPFGHARGRNPSVFLPVGTNAVTLVVSDEWSSSAPRQVWITVTQGTKGN